MIPAEAKPSLQGAFPSALATCHPDGTPNVTHISQVWYVDPTHLALSFQFFNKTIANVRANPRAAIRTGDPQGNVRWLFEARFVRSEQEGPVFEDMEIQLEVIASMTGMQDVFKLKAADIYEVTSVRRLTFFA